ncbi:hypothetical protein [Psychroflexus sp. ALD_RP9]|uniref:hypothetical protein n=1 Tax=Psychroflexus sp. ALD_RP9 TaxID=2777186 RepID=UPI001A8C49BF|nr:hypothetical protein [Psychroflexus sp. ALD_RP9]QSS97343.1 hypothetical protein IMZ30_01095 [Psychroflexus sp. ALD_RP9]
MKKFFTIIALSAITLSLNANNAQLQSNDDCESYAMTQAASEFSAGYFTTPWASLDSYFYYLGICEDSDGIPADTVIID